MRHPTRLHLQAVRRRRRYGPKIIFMIALDIAVTIGSALVAVAMYVSH